ncbi:NAD-glutamate dehydrogenase [Sphingomonas sp. ID0503]|uniref:NAD-glutamate dehydrogenase n=1 Tax=Sphingomonas sp. ID0503 TaxID=3399691 RepID=UPI003AFB247E
MSRIFDALSAGPLPGDNEDFGGPALAEAAAFVAGALASRTPGTPRIEIGAMASEGARRRMRVAVVNDDMPFLVDSVAALFAAYDLTIHRLLHPILAVRRDAGGALTALPDRDAGGERLESVIYLETDRADGGTRRRLADEIASVLGDVRAAVEDWPKLRAVMAAEAAKLPDGEGAALVRWFAERHMTLLGHRIEARDGTAGETLGFLRTGNASLWDAEDRAAAFAWFEQGGEAPLLIKSSCIATVHRRAPLDLVILPVREGGAITALSLHAGLWTSEALSSSPEKVPVLRSRLRAMEDRFGFDPRSHAGKALRHAFSTLPHDIAVGLRASALEEAVLTSMSLADRPRSKLLLLRAPVGTQVLAFAWLPREEFSTERRVAIGNLIAEATGGDLIGFRVELGDGNLALVRFTIADVSGDLPDIAPLDARLESMLRGWAAAVEDVLARETGATHAARLAIAYANAFPAAYRSDHGAESAAQDILLLDTLAVPDARTVRLFRGKDGLALKTYRLGGSIALSEAVPVFENFGFVVQGETPVALDEGRIGHIQEFGLEVATGVEIDEVLARAHVIEGAITAVLEHRAENDVFNQLVVLAGLDPRETVLFRAWFRYLRQTGLSYGLETVVGALRRAPEATRGLIDLFFARHDPSQASDGEQAAEAVDAALTRVTAIDDDRILRRIRAVILATLRTNAFSPAADEALAFKLDSAAIPGLPAPRPWREIWVYSPRVEGIHLRGGPVARGGLRWSDRRDDFRTEILGLMKAQVVKNAVIVPTGAKGGFYPKRLPAPSDRDAWMAEGTESYRVFIRTLLSVTDNIVDGAVTHPDGVVIRDGDDPYFVVAADKGTASFSDVANAIALERGFWLGDAFASGGSQGYDHKAMGITAKGAWISVTRHFAEMGVDVQNDPVRVAGCGDMSGDVFGNGMLLSKSLKLVAAFDHRHIFLDPEPDPAKSWAERERMFKLPRSSWADYDKSLISAGGGVFPRDQKSIPLSAEVKAMLDLAEDQVDPSTLIAAILKARVDLLWFGGIGTYIKGASQTNAQVGDGANDAHRVNGGEVRAKVIGEGANLSTTQAGRIEFAEAGGRINTDFIDNSAGVDCSDNEVNIKIPLNREMIEGRLEEDDRNTFLVSMTDDVARIVLEDNRLQTLALSVAESRAVDLLRTHVRVIETLEASGRMDRAVEGLATSEELLRRGQDGQGLTRPELSVLLAHTKLALQAAIEASPVPTDSSLEPILRAAFPPAMQERFRAAIDDHRLRPQIIATKVANKVVNRLGFANVMELAEDEGVAIAQVAAAYLAASQIFDLDSLWRDLDAANIAEPARINLLGITAGVVRLHIADLLRVWPADALPGDVAKQMASGVDRVSRAREDLLKEEARRISALLRQAIEGSGADQALIDRIVHLAEMDGAIGTATLAGRIGTDEVSATQAYVKLGEALGLDWAKAAALRLQPTDPWERLLAAGLTRDFEQLRLDFLTRAGDADPGASVDRWLQAQEPRVAQFRALIARAQNASTPSPAMLAQIASQARVLLGR